VTGSCGQQRSEGTKTKVMVSGREASERKRPSLQIREREEGQGPS